MKNLYTMIIVVILGGYAGHTVLADCTGDYPTAWMNVYWDNDPYNYEDTIAYDAYVVDGKYRLAISDVSNWWDNRISAIECFENYPCHWWVYDDVECGTFLEEGDGGECWDLEHNDTVASLKFRANEQRTWFTFCEHDDCGGEGHQLRLYTYGNSYEVVWELRCLDGHWNDKISAVESGVSGPLNGDHAYWYFYKHKDFKNSENKKHPPDLILKDNDENWDLGEMDNQITSFRLVISDDDTPPTVQSYSGDINCDGIVGNQDFVHLADAWQKEDCGCCELADLNLDQQINLFDLAILVDDWLEGLPVY